MQCQVCSSIFAISGSQQEQQQAQVETAGSQLAATVQLILQLVRYSFGMSLEDVNVLTAHLSPQVHGTLVGNYTLYMCTIHSVCAWVFTVDLHWIWHFFSKTLCLSLTKV